MLVGRVLGSRAMRSSLVCFVLGGAVFGCDGGDSPSKNGDAKVDSKGDAKSDAKADKPSTPDDAWVEHVSKEAGFKVRFPVAPTIKKELVPSGDKPLDAVFYTAERGGVAAALSVITLPEEKLEGIDIEGATDAAQRGALKAVDEATVKIEKITFAGQSARAVVASGTEDGTDFRIELRLFFKSPRMYQLQLTVPREHPDKDAKTLFDSFSFTAP